MTNDSLNPMSEIEVLDYKGKRYIKQEDVFTLIQKYKIAIEVMVKAIGDASICKDEEARKLDQSPANLQRGEISDADTMTGAVEFTPAPKITEIRAFEDLQRAESDCYLADKPFTASVAYDAVSRYLASHKPVSVAESCRIYEREITRQIDDKEDIDRPKALKAVLGAAGVKYE